MDTDEDGQQDADEPPMQNVVVQIVDPSTGHLWSRETTDAQGQIYAFSAGGQCGQYSLYLSIPDGYWPTTRVVANTPPCDEIKFGLRPYP